jgi:NADPH-dependent curcumin reductase CurA
LFAAIGSMNGLVLNKYFLSFIKYNKYKKEGKIQIRDTIIEGFENIPKAFFGIFNGQNIGKMVVKL